MISTYLLAAVMHGAEFASYRDQVGFSAKRRPLDRKTLMYIVESIAYTLIESELIVYAAYRILTLRVEGLTREHSFVRPLSPSRLAFP